MEKAKLCIRLAKKNDVKSVARIHEKEINSGFISSLGADFLSKFFEAMVGSRNAFLIVAEENKKIIGFSAGTTSTRKFLFEFLRKNFFYVILILLKKASFSTALKAIETINYALLKKKHLPRAEFLDMAVEKDFQRKGVASLMFKRLVLEMKKRKIKIFRSVIGANKKASLHFHEKYGFKFLSDITVHKNALSKAYVFEIK